MSQSRRQAFTGCIPQETIIEILLRANVKTLLRSKCVCKLWRSLISDTSFIRKHFDRIYSMSDNSKQHHMLFTNGCGSQLLSVSIYSLLISEKFMFPPNPTRHIQPLMKKLRKWFLPKASCYGLVLLDTSDAPVLWNPSIQEVKILPGFARDTPGVFLYEFGLGFDPLTNDFKVIKVVSCDDDASRERHGWQLWLCSSKANSWRRIQLPCKIELINYPKIVSDIVFWVIPHERTIISFNIVMETFHELPLPQDKNFADLRKLEFGVSAGNLYLLYYDGSYVDIWRMDEHGRKEFWLKQFSFVHAKEIHEANYLTPNLLYMSGDEVMLGYTRAIAIYNKLNGLARLGLYYLKKIFGVQHTHMRRAYFLLSVKYWCVTLVDLLIKATCL